MRLSVLFSTAAVVSAYGGMPAIVQEKDQPFQIESVIEKFNDLNIEEILGEFW